jgi:hypothetical protein
MEAYANGKQFKFIDVFPSTWIGPDLMLADEQGKRIIVDFQGGMNIWYKSELDNYQEKKYTDICLIEIYEEKTKEPENYDVIFRRKRDENLRNMFS